TARRRERLKRVWLTAVSRLIEGRRGSDAREGADSADAGALKGKVADNPGCDVGAVVDERAVCMTGDAAVEEALEARRRIVAARVVDEGVGIDAVEVGD